LDVDRFAAIFTLFRRQGAEKAWPTAPGDILRTWGSISNLGKGQWGVVFGTLGGWVIKLALNYGILT
jgi:hypothetical protein